MTFLGDVDWVIKGNPDPEKVQILYDFMMVVSPFLMVLEGG